MSPAHVLEPTYRRLKRALMDGAWPPGTRLEALRLADEFGVSMTPVRDSLNHLAGEGLVDLTPGEGFRVPLMNEQALRDILSVNVCLLESAIETNLSPPATADRDEPSVGYASRIAAAFLIIGRGSNNEFLAQIIDGISYRLHPVRSREQAILPGAMQLLEQVESSLKGSVADRRHALMHYHSKCQEVVPRLIASLA